jgi:hypothetical protein
MAFEPYEAFLINQLTNPIGIDAPGNIKLALAIVRRPNVLVGQRGAAAGGLADRGDCRPAVLVEDLDESLQLRPSIRRWGSATFGAKQLGARRVDQGPADRLKKPAIGQEVRVNGIDRDGASGPSHFVA